MWVSISHPFTLLFRAVFKYIFQWGSDPWMQSLTPTLTESLNVRDGFDPKVPTLDLTEKFSWKFSLHLSNLDLDGFALLNFSLHHMVKYIYLECVSFCLYIVAFVYGVYDISLFLVCLMYCVGYILLLSTSAMRVASWAKA